MNVGTETVVVTAGDGRRLEVLTTEGTATAVVVLHLGTPAGLVELPFRLVDRTRARIVMYARPGYGASTAQPGRSVADAAGDTATILDALGIDEFVTAGWSGGGPHALACAALLADRCRATAIVAGTAPAMADVQDWSGSKMDLARRRDDEGLAAALEVDRAASETVQAADMSAMFTSEPDRAALTNGYAAWVAASFRAGYASGVAGARDDWMALVRDWGFELADARQVTLWQGGCDDSVTPANAHWLADRIPDSGLRMLPGEGHMSIGLRLPEILDDLLIRAPASRDAEGRARN